MPVLSYQKQVSNKFLKLLTKQNNDEVRLMLKTLFKFVNLFYGHWKGLSDIFKCQIDGQYNNIVIEIFIVLQRFNLG